MNRIDGSIQGENLSVASHSTANPRPLQNRWILVEFIPVVQGNAHLGKHVKEAGNSPDGKTIWAALKQSVLTNFGDTGWGAVGLSLTGMSLQEKVCITY